MQSLGNDFIVIDGVSEEINKTPEGWSNMARRLADRHFGVGCDQVLLVQPGDHDDNGGDTGEFRFRIFNHDGGEVEQCGNGARCLARFIYERGLVSGTSARKGEDKIIRVRTCKLAMTLTINPDESVTVEMGIPEFSPPKIPFQADFEAPTYALNLNGSEVEISALAIGNPHAVRRVDDIARAPLATHGPLTENHPRFPARVNAGFMQITARDHIRLRVHERGAGETLGCGSGACAAVVAGINLGLLAPRVTVSLPGGDAKVEWQGPGNPVFLTGPAYTIFDGIFHGEVDW